MENKIPNQEDRIRCRWCNTTNPLYVDYHDHEWGIPVHEDGKLFEMLLLETFQAGLSWECVLNKREAFRRAFDGFDATKIAVYDEEKLLTLQQDKGIIRNRLKIQAAVTNARIFNAVRQEYGSFDRYIWHFTDPDSLRNRPYHLPSLGHNFQRSLPERDEICGEYHHLFLPASHRHHQLP